MTQTTSASDSMQSRNAAPPSGTHKSTWSVRERIGRALWIVVRASLFRLSWHNWYAWRNVLLRLFGTRVGRRVRVRPTVAIEIPWLLELGDYCTIGDHAVLYDLGPMRIGRRVLISQYAHLCGGTHDHTRPELPLVRTPITVGDDAWIAADAFVGPGVNVGEGAVLGARASAFSDLEPWTIYGGNPARPLGPRQTPTDS